MHNRALNGFLINITARCQIRSSYESVSDGSSAALVHDAMRKPGREERLPALQGEDGEAAGCRLGKLLSSLNVVCCCEMEATMAPERSKDSLARV